jgi:hypothetical protein
MAEKRFALEGFKQREHVTLRQNASNYSQKHSLYYIYRSSTTKLNYIYTSVSTSKTRCTKPLNSGFSPTEKCQKITRIFNHQLKANVNRRLDRIVGIATDYGWTIEVSEFESRWVQGYSPRRPHRLRCPPYLSNAYRGLFPRGKGKGREADHSPPTSAEVKKPFQPQRGRRVDSASNKNEYQESSWGVKASAARTADNLTAICKPIVGGKKLKP